MARRKGLALPSAKHARPEPGAAPDGKASRPAPPGGKLAIALVVATLASAAAEPAHAAEKRPGDGVPTIHVNPTETSQFDPSVPSAGLRLLAQELAVRHDVYARIWARERAWRMGDDAFPRIRIRTKRVMTPRYLRVVRKGDRLVALASADGEEYFELGRQTLEALPERVYLGLFVSDSYHQDPATYDFANLSLDGEPFPDHQVENMGNMDTPGEVDRENRKWTIHTSGHAGEPPEPTLTGAFAYTRESGDFVLEVEVREIQVEKAVYDVGGLLCRAGLGRRRAGFGALATGASVVAAWTVPGSERATADDEKQTEEGDGPPTEEKLRPRVTYSRDRAAHVLRAHLVGEDGDKRRLASVPVSVASFDAFTDAARAFADEMRSALERRYGLEGGPAPEPQSLPKELQERLAAARERSLRVGSVSFLEAARKIDAVLEEAPRAAAAHYAAAGVGARLACHELRGVFDLRGRLLGTPVAHLLMARGLRPPRSADEKLDVAWTMLACGYPDRALEAVENLPEDAKDRGEARAIRIFATRDYRKLPVEKLGEASAFEQVAWAWAVQRTGRRDLIRKGGPVLLSRRPAAAYMLLYGGPSVGLNHRLTGELLADAYGQNVRTLLRCKQIPKAKRGWAANQTADVLGLERESPIREIADAAARRAAKGAVRPEKHLAELIDKIVPMYWQAWRRTGPVAPADGSGGAWEWRTLGARSLARFDQSLLLLALHRRTTFLGGEYGDTRVAAEYAKAAANGFGRMKKHRRYFRALAKNFLGRYGEAGKLLKRVSHELPYFSRPGFMDILMRRWGGSAYERYDGVELRAPGGRGSWAWGLSSHLAMSWARYDMALANGLHAHQVDRHDAHHVAAFQSFTENLGLLVENIGRMPYNARQIRWAAREAADRPDRLDLAIRLRKRLVEMQPTVSRHYGVLEDLYRRKGERERAFEVLEKGVERASPGVGRSNLRARYADVLRHRGKVERALEEARQAAETYSAPALQALAWALEANGKKKKAMKVVRAAYRRYPGHVALLVSLMEARGRTGERLLEELRRYKGVHPEAGPARLHAYAVRSGEPDFLRRLYDEGLITPAADERLMHLMQCALYGRRFERALDLSEAIAERRERSVYELVWTYIAARLAGKKQTIDALREPAEKHTDHVKLAPVVRFIRGEIDRARLRWSGGDRKLRWAYIHWLLGVEAEADGDLKKARRQYREARDMGAESVASRIPFGWARALADRPEARKETEAARGRGKKARPPGEADTDATAEGSSGSGRGR